LTFRDPKTDISHRQDRERKEKEQKEISEGVAQEKDGVTLTPGLVKKMFEKGTGRKKKNERTPGSSEKEAEPR